MIDSLKVSVMEQVNAIFSSTDFGDGLTYAMEIKRVVIHEQPSDDPLYNADRSGIPWIADELLRVSPQSVFIKHRIFKSYCT